MLNTDVNGVCASPGMLWPHSCNRPIGSVLMKKMSALAKLYVSVTIALGALAVLPAASQWKFSDPVRYCCYLLVALFASGLKVRLPGVKGTMSVSYVFILLGIAELSFAEIVLLGVLSTAVQIFWRPKSPPQPMQVYFNLASMMLSVAVSLRVYQALSP